MKRLVKKCYHYCFRHDEWNVGVVSEPITAFLDPDFHPEIHWLSPPEDGFLADPFVIVEEGRVWVLCEYFDFSLFKGRIVTVDITDIDHPSLPQPSLKFPIHTSYPFLVKSDNSIFCIPETAMASEVALYRAVKFPLTWVKAAVLIPGFSGIDNTIFWYDGYWWLACTVWGSSSSLYLWYATALLGPWKPHAANPVKIDISSSRPGGAPFEHEGQLYRPAQNNSQAYGAELVLNRVTKLSPTEFREEVAARVRPDSDGPYPKGLHTLSGVGNITVLDGKRVRFVKSAFKGAVRRGAARIGDAIHA